MFRYTSITKAQSSSPGIKNLKSRKKDFQHRDDIKSPNTIMIHTTKVTKAKGENHYHTSICWWQNKGQIKSCWFSALEENCTWFWDECYKIIQGFQKRMQEFSLTLVPKVMMPVNNPGFNYICYITSHQTINSMSI